MSLMTSLYSGASGMQANSVDLSVIGDNIANANTIGFKTGRAAFEDAVAETLIGGAERGLGAKLQTIQRILTQGALLNTGLATDLAISGPGFFVVEGNSAGVDARFYTRNGQLTLDNDGLLVTLEGLRVQGYMADPNGVISPQLGNLDIGDATSVPRATSLIEVNANLSSEAVVPLAFDPLDPTGTSNFQTSVTIYDSLGTSHEAQVYFRKNGVGDWEWHALVDGASINGGTPGVLSEIANGTMQFDAAGALINHTQASNFNPVGALQPQPLTFDFGTPTAAAGTGLDGITQFAGTSAVSFQNQDGVPSGMLTSIAIDELGTVVGTFTNGESRALGQVVVADFAAPEQLRRMGGNLYLESLNSGGPTIGVAATGGRGVVTAGALEQSNVDLAGEFVRMIAAQRGFQANSKTITTADQLLSELIQIKR